MHLADLAWLRCLNELISRLPVLFVTSAGRLGVHSATASAEGLDAAADCCQRCCNVVFDVLLDAAKQLRGDVEFQSIWIRFVGTLSTNAAAASRAGAALQGLQSEMADMLEALLRLLRLPPTAIAEVAVAQPSANAHSATVGPVMTTMDVPPQSSVFSVFGWFAAQPQPALPSAQSAVAATSPPTGATVSRVSRVVYDLDCDPRLHDGALLVSSWRAVHSVFPQLTGALRSKNPKLLAAIVLFVECSDAQSLRKRHEQPSDVQQPAAISTEDSLQGPPPVVPGPAAVRDTKPSTPALSPAAKSNSRIQTV